jgi:hypothetical protein
VILRVYAKESKKSFSASESLHQRIKEQRIKKHSWRIREHSSAKQTLKLGGIVQFDSRHF